MSEAKYTPGPWCVDTTVALGPYGILTQSEDVPQAECIVCSFPNTRRSGPERYQRRERLEADARLIAAAPDRHEQVIALTLLGWTVEKVSLYEEGVEGWRWLEPTGTEHEAIGDWSELPPWPDSARSAVAKGIEGLTQ